MFEDKEKFENFILEGQFNEAYDIIKYTDLVRIENILFALAYDKSSIQPYFFYLFLLSQNLQPDFIHKMAYIILSSALNWMPGAYFACLYHLKQYLNLKPDDVKMKEAFMLLYENPEDIVSLDEAKYEAKKILEIDPTNYNAKRFILK